MGSFFRILKMFFSDFKIICKQKMNCYKIDSKRKISLFCLFTYVEYYIIMTVYTDILSFDKTQEETLCAWASVM